MGNTSPAAIKRGLAPFRRSRHAENRYATDCPLVLQGAAADNVLYILTS